MRQRFRLLHNSFWASAMLQLCFSHTLSLSEACATAPTNPLGPHCHREGGGIGVITGGLLSHYGCWQPCLIGASEVSRHCVAGDLVRLAPLRPDGGQGGGQQARGAAFWAQTQQGELNLPGWGNQAHDWGTESGLADITARARVCVSDKRTCVS